MKQKTWTIALLCALLLTGCGNTLPDMQPTDTAPAVQESAAAETATEIAPETTQAETVTADESSLAVATGDDVIEADAVGYEGMEPVPAEAVKEGEYQISVDSSSSMFKIADCRLTVADGKMTAALTIGSKSYEYLFAGTAEQAAQADVSAFIAPDETDSGCIFTFPVEALNQAIDCAAFSRKKQLWYDRKLVFRADSLPEDALPQQEKVTAASLGLADGEYTVDVTLEGGSGKASVQSPAKLTVSGGQAAAEIIWSSNKYDYMIVDGEKYEPTDTTEFSVFEIPVSAFDRKLKITADTTAMSTPHEIEYTLYFDSASVK
ncbi:MAG: hypothetical protein IJL32_14235 [Oscillospiraceae bacterium]|nr:hypothetical protein [Oscillospiraceae bacterium]